GDEMQCNVGARITCASAISGYRWSAARDCRIYPPSPMQQLRIVHPCEVHYARPTPLLGVHTSDVNHCTVFCCMTRDACCFHATSFSWLHAIGLAAPPVIRAGAGAATHHPHSS